MIVFDLRCGHDHVFEAWFRSTADYDDQRERGLIACPVCSDSRVAKAVMAPNVAAKGNRRAAVPMANAPGDPSPEQAREMLAQIAALQAKILEKSEWVGADFADRARAMHEGDAPAQQIHGQATPDEAQALVDDGVAVMPLLVPVVPPEARN